MILRTFLALAVSCTAICANAQGLSSDQTTATPVAAEYFEGRWAFEDDSCTSPTNWTLIAGGNFVSEDVTGTWGWDGEMLTLSLMDLAMDEETGETGGRFQMQGPIEIKNADAFAMTIEPDIYKMKKCP